MIDQITGNPGNNEKPSNPGEELTIKQFKIIVEGLQIEYKGRINGLVDLCSDSRFIRAKENLTRIVGRVRASEVLHDIF